MTTTNTNINMMENERPRWITDSPRSNSSVLSQSTRSSLSPVPAYMGWSDSEHSGSPLSGSTGSVGRERTFARLERMRLGSGSVSPPKTARPMLPPMRRTKFSPPLTAKPKSHNTHRRAYSLSTIHQAYALFPRSSSPPSSIHSHLSPSSRRLPPIRTHPLITPRRLTFSPRPLSYQGRTSGNVASSTGVTSVWTNGTSGEEGRTHQRDDALAREEEEGKFIRQKEGKERLLLLDSKVAELLRKGGAVSMRSADGAKSWKVYLAPGRQ
ncbi:hypothetical protein M231_03220 [Tremella mesenterica]|uniref:Uncharacterized protein n=1 Tax=Tremella mesenterica TaxID=5217 RepID=A0A4Q1BNU2_TREME|nr:hypothetical protein M231_03220 [Tremella mesenterica]